ncbi:hypothetical protein JOD54_005442 [Actinokineospora baliensis]|nr:hypothetical protein [Actinokineospora baliensis]
MPSARWGGLVLCGVAAVVALPRCRAMLFGPGFCGPATAGAGAPRKTSSPHRAPRTTTDPAQCRRRADPEAAGANPAPRSQPRQPDHWTLGSRPPKCSMGRTCFVWGSASRSVSARTGPCFSAPALRSCHDWRRGPAQNKSAPSSTPHPPRTASRCRRRADPRCRPHSLLDGVDLFCVGERHQTGPPHRAHRTTRPAPPSPVHLHQAPPQARTPEQPPPSPGRRPWSSLLGPTDS